MSRAGKDKALTLEAIGLSFNFMTTYAPVIDNFTDFFFESVGQTSFYRCKKSRRDTGDMICFGSWPCSLVNLGLLLMNSNDVSILTEHFSALFLFWWLRYFYSICSCLVSLIYVPCARSTWYQIKKIVVRVL